MKRCPTCQRAYTDATLKFCRHDGTLLISDLSSEISETLILSSAPRYAETRTQTFENAPSIAVLPFANLSADAENEYFCDGLAEELLNALAKIEGLKVAARTSAFSFKGKNVAMREIGEALRVNTVLEGSVRKSGNRLRITVQLVNVADGYHLWSERYDREMKDIFDVQDEITLAVVDALKVKLFGEEKAAVLKRYTENAKAYELYLKGRYFWEKRTPEDVKKGMAHFQSAIEIDPNFALAYAGLADCFLLLALNHLVRPQEAFTNARNLATKALALDDTLIEAHGSLAAVRFYEWDWQGCESELQRALQLNPNNGWIHLGFAMMGAIAEQTEQVLTEARKALELEPMSLTNKSGVGYAYYFARQYELAREQARGAIELNPQFYSAYRLSGLVNLAQGRYAEAISDLERASRLDISFIKGALGYAYAVAGERGAAQKILAELLARAKEEFVSAYDIALIYVGLDDKEQAFAWLERACEERTGWLIYLKVDRCFDNLRADPRFQDLLRRIGLTGY